MDDVTSERQGLRHPMRFARRSTQILSRLIQATLAAAMMAAAAGCAPRADDGRIHIRYWEKWSGAEAEAMQRTVDAFNRSQDRIFVEFLSLGGGIDRSVLLATAGGDPPDIAGVWPQQLASWADRNALTPLDDFIRADGQTPAVFLARYEASYAEMTQYGGRVYALYATPASHAFYWNKALFREAGLDPERPPATVEELMEYSRRLTRRDPRTGALTQVGFLPQDPGWWPWSFPSYFAGDLVRDGEIVYDKLPENVRSMEWVRSYTEEYGLADLRTFATGFGQFGSPQYPFFAGKIAMCFQGVWLNNYMRQYAPGLDYGVAGWPAATHPGDAPFANIEGDMLVIPRGAKHPREAWEFLKYANSCNPRATSLKELSGIELTCFLQEKNSPLREWSPFFAERHPHPYISVFRDLARSPRAYHVPYVGVWSEYMREINAAFDRVRFLEATPEEALRQVQQRIAPAWAEHRRRLQRREAQRVRRSRGSGRRAGAVARDRLPERTSPHS